MDFLKGGYSKSEVTCILKGDKQECKREVNVGKM